MAMAAYGTHAKNEGFAFLPITSFNMACTTFISQNLGAKQYGRAKKGAAFSILAAVFLAQLIGICYYLFAPQLVGFFDKTPAWSLLAYSRHVLFLYFIASWLFPTQWPPSAGAQEKLSSQCLLCFLSGV